VEWSTTDSRSFHSDPVYFSPLSSSSSNPKALSENWVLRFNNLKRLYKLLIRYFECVSPLISPLFRLVDPLFPTNRDVLHSSTAALHTPNLQLVAKGDDGSDDEVCKLAGLVLALVVQVRRSSSSPLSPLVWPFHSFCQSEFKQQHVLRIQGLEEWVQRELMYSIEQVCLSPFTLFLVLSYWFLHTQVMSKVKTAEKTIVEEDEDEEDEYVVLFLSLSSFLPSPFPVSNPCLPQRR
jgi:hypothetical protein